MLLTSRFAMSSLAEPDQLSRRFADRILCVDTLSGVPPIPGSPLSFVAGNTLSVLLPLLVAASPRRIFLFGADGGADPDGATRMYSYEHVNNETQKRRREGLRRFAHDAWFCDRLAPLQMMAVGALFRVPVPPVYNCSPHSRHEAFPKISVDTGLRMLSGEP